MKDLRKETAKLITEISKNLITVVTGASFEFWERKDFRLYIKFETLSKTEWDRMFNELEVSALGLFILHFETLPKDLPEEKRIVFTSLQRDLAPAFLQLYIELGIEKPFLNQWSRLVDMRLKEYREHFAIAEKDSRTMREFQGNDKDLRINWALIETITIDCLTHLRRGKVEKGDPLWKLLRKWFISLYGQLHPITKLS